MDSTTKTAFTRIETQLQSLSAQVQTVQEQSELTARRLLELVTLLTPQKNNDDAPLSDLFAHLIMIGREQLNLARRTLDSIAALREQITPANDHADDVSGSRRPQ